MLNRLSKGLRCLLKQFNPPTTLEKRTSLNFVQLHQFNTALLKIMRLLLSLGQITAQLRRARHHIACGLLRLVHASFQRLVFPFQNQDLSFQLLYLLKVLAHLRHFGETAAFGSLTEHGLNSPANEGVQLSICFKECLLRCLVKRY